MATVRRWLAAAAAQGTGTSGFARYRKTDGSAAPVGALYFDGAVSETSHWEFPIPVYGSGNLTATVYWFGDTGTSGGVVWECAIGAITPNVDTGSVEAKAYATAATATDTHLGTTAKRLHTIDVTITALDGLAAGDYVQFRLTRLPANAGDTLSGYAACRGVDLSWSDT